MCAGTATNPDNVHDESWSTVGSCQGKFGTGTACEYTAVSDPASVEFITSAFLEVAFSVAGFDVEAPDTIYVEVSNDDGASWETLESIASETELQSHTFDVGAIIGTKQEAVDARVRFRVEQNQAADQLTIRLGGLLLSIQGEEGRSTPVVTIIAPAEGSRFALGEAADFVGAASDWEDGDLGANIAWSSDLDGPIGVGSSISAVLSEGSHIVTAAVHDSAGNTAEVAITLIVVEGDAGPVVAISDPVDGARFGEGALVTLSGVATDLGGGELSSNVLWSSSLDGPIGSGASVSTAILSPGSHTIIAEATDSAGNTGSDAIELIIDGAVAAMISSPANGSSFIEGSLISLAGTTIDLEDGERAGGLTWSSSLDGPIGSGGHVTVSSLSVGRHTITARATDSFGNVGSAAITVIISADAPPMVSSSAPEEGASFDSWTTVSLQGSATDAEDGRLDASIVWSSNIDGHLGTGASISVVLSDGSHIITAEVTDSAGNTGSDTTWIIMGLEATPHGGYSASTDNCATCHRTHTSESPALIAAAFSGNLFCFTCHDGSGASVPPYASTHSNIDFPGVEASFETQCVQCHNPHGSSNLDTIREDVYVVYPNITSGPVTFTATSGPDSYDDGLGSTAERICTVCHDNASNPGYPMTNHIGGADHGGSIDYAGTNCTGCHPHSADTEITTQDGFMPSGSGCTGCHSVPTDNGDGIPPGGRRQITGTGGDFERASHHVHGEVDDVDCEVCHEQTQHQNGVVRLYNVDNLSIVYALDGVGDSAEMEVFCLACHDSDGAGGLAPFTDTIMPPVIDATGWALASHSSPGGYYCGDCHDNGHGSNKVSLLAPWGYSDDGDADDPMMEEERFCYDCHDNDGPAASDVASTFAPATNWVATAAGENTNASLNDRHDIALTDQAISGVKIECTDCHDPHLANSELRLIADPDPDDGRTPGAGYFSQTDDSGLTWTTDFSSDWCLDCHDGSFRSSITPPATAIVDIYGAWGGSGNTHGAASGRVSTLEGGFGYVTDMVVQCLDCHARHVSVATPETGATNLFHLKAIVMTADGSAQVPTDDGGFAYEYTNNNVKDPVINGYDWCQTCHLDSMGSMKANCDTCHYHGPSGRW